MFSTTELQIFQNNTQGSTVFIISKPVIGVSIGPLRPFARSIEQALPACMRPKVARPFDVEPRLGVAVSVIRTPEYWSPSDRLARAARLLPCLRKPAVTTFRPKGHTWDHGYGERKLGYAKTLLPSNCCAQPSTEYPSYSYDDRPRCKHRTNPSLGTAGSRIVQMSPRAFTVLRSVSAQAGSVIDACASSRLRDCAYQTARLFLGAAAYFWLASQKRNHKGYSVKSTECTSLCTSCTSKASAKRETGPKVQFGFLFIFFSFFLLAHLRCASKRKENKPRRTKGSEGRKHQTVDAQRVPTIIRQKYKNFVFIGAILRGQIMNSLDFKLYTTLDHSSYNQFINTINYNPLINVFVSPMWDFQNQISRPVTLRLMGLLTSQSRKKNRRMA